MFMLFIVLSQISQIIHKKLHTYMTTKMLENYFIKTSFCLIIFGTDWHLTKKVVFGIFYPSTLKDLQYKSTNKYNLHVYKLQIKLIQKSFLHSTHKVYESTAYCTSLQSGTIFMCTSYRSSWSRSHFYILHTKCTSLQPTVQVYKAVQSSCVQATGQVDPEVISILYTQSVCVYSLQYLLKVYKAVQSLRVKATDQVDPEVISTFYTQSIRLSSLLY